MFEQEAYTINEADKIAMPILLLSNQSSYPITVEVFSIDGSAIGKQALSQQACNVIVIYRIWKWYGLFSWTIHH